MKKLLYLSLATIMCLMCLCLFSGCAIKYHATMDSHAQRLLTDEFLAENRIYGYYYNYTDLTAPDTRTIVLTENDDLTAIFKEPKSINFEKKMVILYIFGDCYPRDYNLKKVNAKDRILNITFKLQFRGNIKDAVMLYQRCFMVTLDKITVDEINFIRQR